MRKRLILLGTTSLFAVALVAAPVQFSSVTPDLAVAYAGNHGVSTGGSGAGTPAGGGAGGHGGTAGSATGGTSSRASASADGASDATSSSGKN